MTTRISRRSFLAGLGAASVVSGLSRTEAADASSMRVGYAAITWGGDIATVHANGNGVATAPGSIFGKLGLNLRLVREEAFLKQLDTYLSGKSPYLPGTLGMINLAVEAASRDPRTKPVVIYHSPAHCRLH